MIVKSIPHPFDSEHVAAVDPVPQRSQVDFWHRRLNFFEGRTLSDTALTLEQDSRAGRLAMRGRMASPGIVFGLEASVADRGRLEGETLVISAGMGLCASGEDVSVLTSWRIPLLNIPVIGAAHPEGDQPPEMPPGDAVTPRPNRRPIRSDVKAEGPDAALGELLNFNLAPPPLAIVLLQPIVAEVRADFDPRDPCEQDPEEDPFEDRRMLDGCRVWLQPWPEGWPDIPIGPTQRNEATYEVFRREQALARGDLLPWEAKGLAIGLIAFDPLGWTVFLDRNSVVRAGGRPRTRRPLVDGLGAPALWQARLIQLTEQVSDATQTSTTAPALLTQFRFLPPCGILPKNAVDLTARRDLFFPDHYDVEIAPVPLEQIDSVVASCAPLSTLDLQQPGQVRILVPVPQNDFETRLLINEPVDPSFFVTLADFRDDLGRTLHRRHIVRNYLVFLYKALTGDTLEFPDGAPAPGETEGTQPPVPPEENPYGVESASDGVNPADMKSTELAALRLTLKNDGFESFLGAGFPVDAENKGLDNTINTAQTNIAEAQQVLNASYARVESELYRLRQNVSGQGDATNTGPSQVLSNIVVSPKVSATAKELLLFVQTAKDEKTKVTPRTGVVFNAAVLTGTAAPAVTRAAVSRAAVPLTAAGAFAGPAAGISTSVSGIAPQVFTGPAATATNISPALGISTGIGSSISTGVIGISPQFGGISTGIGSTSTGIGGISAGTISTGIGGISVATGGKGSSIFDIGVASGVLYTSPASRFSSIIDDVAVGKIDIPRDIPVATLIERPKSVALKDAAVTTRLEILTSIAKLKMPVTDLPIPGYPIPPDPNANPPRPTVTHGVVNFTADSAQNLQIAQNSFSEPDPGATNAPAGESDYFSLAVTILENTLSALRGLEGRLASFKVILSEFATSRGKIADAITKADVRLAELETILGTDRQNVTAALALLDEETARIAGVNSRRAQILSQEVPFVFYHRLITTEPVASQPFRDIDPALTVDVTPVCLQQNLTPPPDLDRFIQLFSDMPLAWFAGMNALLDQLNSLNDLRYVYTISKQRAVRQYTEYAYAPRQDSFKAGKLSAPIGAAYYARQQVVADYRLSASQVDLGIVAGLTWQGARTAAPQVITVGDLIEAAKGRTSISQSATQQMRRVGQVATCFYVQCNDVAPDVRLLWAQRIADQELAVSFRTLGNLPGWERIPVLQRKEMQVLVDYLYSQINLAEPQATAMMDDLVRTCILLATHEPVESILTGEVQRAASATAGSRIEVKVPIGSIKIGMSAVFQKGKELIAHAVVEDLTDDLASVRIVQSYKPQEQIAFDTAVQFAGEQTTLAKSLSKNFRLM